MTRRLTQVKFERIADECVADSFTLRTVCELTCRIDSRDAVKGAVVDFEDAKELGLEGEWTIVEVYDSLDEKIAEGRAHGHTKWKKKLEGKTKKGKKDKRKA